MITNNAHGRSDAGKHSMKTKDEAWICKQETQRANQKFIQQQHKPRAPQSAAESSKEERNTDAANDDEAKDQGNVNNDDQPLNDEQQQSVVPVDEDNEDSDIEKHDEQKHDEQKLSSRVHLRIFRSFAFKSIRCVDVLYNFN